MWEAPSVSEGQATRAASSRDLLALNAAAVLGAASVIALNSLFGTWIPGGAELNLVSGAFLVGYLRRFGTLGAGLGSQIYIGQLLAYGAGLAWDDLRTVALAGMIAALASIVPRLLSGRAERPASAPGDLPLVPVTFPDLAFGYRWVPLCSNRAINQA